MKPVLSLIALTVVGVVAAIPVSRADPFPQACVSCHVVDKSTGKDHRLGTALAAWTAGKVGPQLLAQTKASMPAGVAVKGKHPKAEDALEDIPGACLDCHAPDAKKAPSFTRLMHLVHLAGAKNTFVTAYKGDCTACHKLDGRTGEWSMPSGPEK